MIKIILYGSLADTKLKNTILQNLSASFKITLYEEGRLTTYGKGKEILLIEADNNSLRSVRTDNCIVVIKKKANVSKIQSISPNVLALVDSDNEEQLADLAALKVSAITCGMSSKDTLTFSSFNLDNAVISLHRSVRTLRKTQIEPMELPVKFTDELDGYHILCYAAVSILTESKEILNHGEIILNYHSYLEKSRL